MGDTESDDVKRALSGQHLHFGGAWQEAAGREQLVVRSPATGDVLGAVPNAGASDVAAAVDAARTAQIAWRTLDALDRARPMRALADLLRARMGELAALESAITGRPIREMRAQMSRIPEWLEYFAGIAAGLEGEANHVRGGFLTYTAWESYGVCALLTPWNHPILILVKKLAAALAAGNSVVIKPSELAPVTPLVLSAWAAQCGFPAGLINVVTGDGRTGAALCAAPEVARIDLTGGTATGRRVAAAAAERLVPCTLELGGKTPVLVFADADIEEAAAGAVFSAFVAAGQTCVSASRFIVDATVYDKFVTAFAERARRLRLADPADPTTDVGPVITAAAQARCIEAARGAERDGARLIVGGNVPALDAPFRSGNFVEPTIAADVNPASALFQEEVFGPVAAVTPFASEEEALALANDTAFALGAAVWTGDVARAHRVARAVRAGVVWINDHHKNDPRSIWGGYGDSGYGKENGWDALKSYQRKRSVVVRTAPHFDDWFGGGQRYG
jgi:acyl-CoA reductase-like NAD-dependent aldehyde dehydrogenase